MEIDQNQETKGKRGKQINLQNKRNSNHKKFLSRKELVKFCNLTIKIPLNYLIQIIYQNNLVKKEGNKNKKQVQSYN